MLLTCPQKTKKLEPVVIEDWRDTGEVNSNHAFTSYDDMYYFIKEEILPSGEKKIILKNKKTGLIEKR